MKILALMTLFACGTADNDKYEFIKSVENRKIETISIFKQRLIVIDKDIKESIYFFNEYEYVSDLIEVNQTLHRDKKILERALSKLGE